MSHAEEFKILPVLPIKNTVLYPYLLLPLAVGRARSQAAVEAAMNSEDKALLVIAQRDVSVEEPGQADLFTIGTEAIIKRFEHSQDAIQMIVQGVRRVEVLELVQAEPYLQAKVRILAEPQDSGMEIEALDRMIIGQAEKIQELAQQQSPVSIGQIISQLNDPLHRTYMLASMMTLDLEKEQALLEAATRALGLQLMHDYLSHEIQVLELRHKIANQAATELNREQREYVLRRQMKAIQEELGEGSPEQAEVAELRERLEQAKLPEEVAREALRELNRLEKLPTAAPDYQMTRSYIEFVLELPWHNTTEDNRDLRHARRVLDEDHYNLKDVKNRIVEHLAVLKLNPQAAAPILCFVGPPGVGKTSLGQSIARALGRKFERMSLGGLHDEAELRGHRRTYIGAMPGRLLQAIRRAGVKNPLLMLDEVDKLGRDFRGDPAAALLEILDPAQNYEFRDNYLNLPFDLSKTFFITTANTLDTIPRPLLDRMEVLRLAGYSEEEKMHIARRYLIPRRLKEAGIQPEQLDVPDDTVRHIVGRYTREAGVRQLERTIGQVARKVAVQFAEAEEMNGNGRPLTQSPLAADAAPVSDATPVAEAGARVAGESPHSASDVQPATDAKPHADAPPAESHARRDRPHVTIKPEDLLTMLGPPPFFLEQARQSLHPGVATGMAWTETGGEILYIEAVLLPEGKELTLTGQLGDVMKESAQAARSYIWSQVAELGIARETMRNSGVHIHVPAGAIPKDGPSAGVAMAVALTSLYTQHPVRNDTAMTGEITLSGLVLPVGGIKEKVLAARRAGIRRIILPLENQKDVRELPEEVRDELEFVPVERIEDALVAAIPAMSERLSGEPLLV